jgi:hypothetical protein
MKAHKPSPESVDLLLDTIRTYAYHLHRYLQEKSPVDNEKNGQLRKNLVDCEEMARSVMESVTGNRWGLVTEGEDLGMDEE